jgi:tubulin-folding cofactor B
MSSTTAATNPTKPVINNRDMLLLKGYITAKDANRRDGLSVTTLLIDLTHSNLVQKHVEIRFDKADRLLDVKHKIHQKTGTAPHFQTLQLKCSGEIIMEIDAHNESYDQYKLGYFFGDELMNCGLEVRCIDTNPLSGSSNGQYEDTSLVKKYKMTDEAYDKRKGTLRDWGREQKERDEGFSLAKHAREHREKCDARREFKLGNFPLPYGYVVDSTGKEIVKGDEPDHDDLVLKMKMKNKNKQGASAAAAAADVAANPEFGESSVEGITVGSRCQVQPGSRRGTVSYVGPVYELDEHLGSCWVGVTFDEPVGKTDGSVANTITQQKTRYFEAVQGYGSFVRGKNVEVGDFPELDLFGDDTDSYSDEDEL